MYHNLEEVERAVLSCRPMRIVVANAHDMNVLPVIARGQRKGICQGILLGDKAQIVEMLTKMGENAGNYDIIDCQCDEKRTALMAVEMVKRGEADIPMKGMMQTASFMHAVLHKADGLLMPGHLLSQATVLENPYGDGFMIISDCAVNIAPDIAAKCQITENAIRAAHRLGIDIPKVAVIAPVETVNPKIESTVAAAAVQQYFQKRGDLRCVVQGPLALDCAISAEAADHKSVRGPVAGHADILIMPDLAAGNLFTKSLTYYANLLCASMLCGPSSPVIMTSRTDTPDNKYASLLLAALR